MATYNTTYNYNQPNMNFGQTLLYGALGSLTGGMGCGGYGMGMSSFGMGGSIFPMGTMMTGYNCYAGGGCYNAEQATGVQIGSMLSSVLIGGITQRFQGRGGNDKQTLASQIETVESDAKKHLETLNKGNKKYSLENDDFKSASINDEPDYQKAIESAQKEIDKVEKDLLPQKRAELASLKSNEPKQDNYTKDGQFDKAAFEKDYAAWDKRRVELEAEIKKYEDSIKENGEYGKTLKKAQDDKAAREKEISDAIEALKPLKEKYDKLVEQQKKEQLEKDINDVDGNAINRTRKSKIEKEYTDNNNSWTRGATAEDIQGALAAYRKNPDEQTKWKDIIKAMVTHKDTTVPKKFKNVLESILGSSLKIKYEE